MIHAWALSLCCLTVLSTEIDDGEDFAGLDAGAAPAGVLLELGSNLTWRGRWQQRVREGGSTLPDLSKIEKDSPFGTGPGRKVTCVGTAGVSLPSGFTEPSLQPLIPARNIEEVWAYNDGGKYGTNVQGMRFAAIAVARGEDSDGIRQIVFGTSVPSSTAVWNDADCDFGTSLKSGARADSAAKAAETNATWEGSTWRIYRQVTCLGTWGSHLPWAFTAPSATPDPVPKSLAEVWESNMAGDYGSNVKGMQYAIVSLMDGQKNGGKYRILFSNALPPESENLWDDRDCEFGTKALLMGASPAALPRKSREKETVFGGTTWRFSKREASCEAEVAKIEPGNVICETNNWWGGWRGSRDCTSQITAQNDMTTWNRGFGVHFTSWAKITLAQPTKLSQVEIFHWRGLQCQYELQYDSGDGRWIKACEISGTIAGKETCSSGFPAAPLSTLRIWKPWRSRCPDGWFRLTGVRVTGAQCQAARCSQPWIARAAWTASGSPNRDRGWRNDINRAINDKYYYVRYRTQDDKKFTITLTLQEAATVAAVGITVGNSPDCRGEGYSGLRIDLQSASGWNMVYSKQEMFGNYERGAQFVAKAKGFAQNKPFFHSFDAVQGVTVVRLTLWWTDICYQSSITLNNIQLVGMPCELQGTTATTTEAFQWAHVNPVLMPQWKQSKSLGREGFWHLWRHGAFTASEVTATSAKRGVRFKATWDTVIMIGLSHGNANDWYWDIDYSMYVHTHWRRLWGRRGPRGWWGNRFLGSHRWSGGDRDIFEVRLNSDRSRVEYVVNRRVLWTAPETAWFPMNIDASVWRGALYDVSWVCDGGCSEEPGYDKVFLATDAKRWGRGPGGPSGSDRPNGEGYTSGEYAVFMQQSLDGCRMLCSERYWCAGFGFKHTDSFGDYPDWQEGSCQLMSRLVETTSRVKNFDSYRKVGTWRSYGPNSACRIGDKDFSEDGVKTVQRLKNVATLEDCKVICQNRDTCTGIEYGRQHHRGDVYCELWSTEIRTSAGMPGVQCLVYDNKKGRFERLPARGCGYGGKCGSTNNLYIGKNGNNYDVATRETAVEVCGPVCEASESCGGFNWYEKEKRCLYRKSATCRTVKNDGRDCYVRRVAPPTDEQDTTTTTTEVYYNGCFRNEGRNRRNSRERGSYTMPKCTELAKKGGFLYFGMEFPQGYSKAGEAECMLLDDIPTMNMAPDNDCRKEVWNKKGLGSGHRIAIYSVIKVCHNQKDNAPHNANFRCHSNDRWWGWRRNNDCSSQITSQSDTWTWGYGRGVHFTQWAEIKLPYAMQLDSFDVYHWTGLRCWYRVQYDQGGSWRHACWLRGTWTGRETCRNRFPKTGTQRLRIIKHWNRRCPDRWFRLTGVDAYGKSCQACARTVLDVDESQRSYNSVYGNNRKGTGHAQSRLNSPQAWSARTRSKNSWMQMDLGAKYYVAGVVTRGRAFAWQWVTSYVVQYSNNNRNFFNAPGGHGGNRDRNTNQQVMFLRPVSARYIRIVVKSWRSWPSMRAAAVVCNPMLPVVERGGRLTQALSSSCSGYDMRPWVGDDGGLLWFNGNFVYYEGDWRITRSWAGNSIRLNTHWGWNWHRESVHADPVSGQIYHLLNHRGHALSSYQTFSFIDCLNQWLGRTSRARLAHRFQIHWYRVFIGDGEMVVLDRQSRWRIIRLGCSGTLPVRILASMSNFWMAGCERGRQGGILESDGESYYIIHAARYVYRRAISGPARNQVKRLSGWLGDICSLAVDYKRNRWYYHREGGGRFHEGIWSCPATFTSSQSQVEDYVYDLLPDNAGTGLYALPMPRHVWPVYLRWRPTYRIANYNTMCPHGWKQYQRNCYRYMGWSNFRGAESRCNVFQAHIFMPESDAEYDWVDANVVRVHSWHWLGVIGSTSGGWTEDPTNVNRLDGKDPFQISSTLSARPSPWHRIDHRWRPCYIFHSRNSYWRYHWHVQHCHEGRYFICKMPLRAQPTSWFHLAQSGYTCGKTNYRDLGSDLTISGCYTASRNDGNCNGQGFHYYPIRLGKFGQCFCGTATDVRDDGTCISKSVESVQNNADYNHIYMYKFFEYYLAGNNYCLAAGGRRAEGSESPAKTLGTCQAACSSDAYCHGFEFYANSKHEDSKCWLFSGHKREGHIIPVRAYTGRRYKDAVCYIKAPYLEDGCANDYGIPGYKFSHLGYWYMHIRTSAGDASLSSCATQCDRARYACIGFHLFEDGNARHCYLYKQERAFHWSVSDGRAKAFVKCKQPTYHANDQSVGWKHFSDHCEEKGQRLCSYQEMCPAGRGREPVGGRQAQTDAWCPIVDNKAPNYVRCGNVGTVCQKLTEFGALARQRDRWPLADTRPDLKDAFACCDA